MTTPPQREGSLLKLSDVLLGESSSAHLLRLQISRIGPHFRVALLTGEPGSGKLTVGRQLHQLSPAPSSEFLAIGLSDLLRCSATNYDSGTLYLRGVETLDRTEQLQFLHLLRTLQGRTRVIIGTQADFKGMTATGRLQPELYKVVSNLELRIPSLRDRAEDIAPIAAAMLHRHNPRLNFTPEALSRLETHPWTGNLRALDAICRQLAPLTGPVRAEDLPLDDSSIASPPPERLEDVLRRHVLTVLEMCSGNKLRAAELLGISRSTLYRMLDAQTTNPVTTPVSP